MTCSNVSTFAFYISDTCVSISSQLSDPRSKIVETLADSYPVELDGHIHLVSCHCWLHALGENPRLWLDCMRVKHKANAYSPQHANKHTVKPSTSKHV